LVASIETIRSAQGATQSSSCVDALGAAVTGAAHASANAASATIQRTRLWRVEKIDTSGSSQLLVRQGFVRVDVVDDCRRRCFSLPVRLAAFVAKDLDDREIALCFLCERHRIGLATRRWA